MFEFVCGNMMRLLYRIYCMLTDGGIEKGVKERRKQKDEGSKLSVF